MTKQNDLSRADRTSEAVDFPEVVLIDNTSACNLKCSMCDHPNISKHRKIQTMDRSLYNKIIDEIAVEKPQARIWEIFFGDPFLCRDMPERIRYAKDKGLTDVVVNTNGQLMTRERARAYIEAGLDCIYVGVDAAKEETYAQIRVGGDFKTAVNNVLGYRDLLRECGRPGQDIFVQFVVSDINQDEVEPFRTFWNNEGVKVKIRPKVSWGGLIEADNLRDNATVERKPCYWLMRTINICADGEVALCSVDVHCRAKCGNVAERSIREIWHDKLQEYRGMHNEGRFRELPPLCRNCPDWQSGYAEYYTTITKQ